MNLNLPRRRGVLSNTRDFPYAAEDLSGTVTPEMIGSLEAMTPGVGDPAEPELIAQPIAVPPSRQLPMAPPSKRQSTNPWAHGNRSRTLLDIGSAFLQSDDFFSGLGQAGQAVGQRMDGLTAANKPTREIGGPGGQFEIVTNPDGTRSVTEIPEFAAYNTAERAAKNAPKPMTPKEVTELRARALYAVGQLPESERSAAYADIMSHPDRYGGLDVSGMPPGYDTTYGTVMGGMGTTVNQQLTDADRDRAFGQRQAVDQRRLDQGDVRLRQGQQRIDKPPASRAARSSPKPPAGFLLD